MSEWQTIDTAPLGEVVLTKIHDADGERNIAKLIRSTMGRLWFLDDGSMYVYYTPTHWMPLPDAPSPLLTPARGGGG